MKGCGNERRERESGKIEKKESEKEGVKRAKQRVNMEAR